MQQRRKRTRGQLAASISHTTPKKSLQASSGSGCATRARIQNRRSNPAHTNSSPTTDNCHSNSTSSDGRKRRRIDDNQSDGQRVSLASLSSILLGLLAPALYLAKVSQPASTSSPRHSRNLQCESSRSSSRRNHPESTPSSSSAPNLDYNALSGHVRTRKRRPRRERRPPPQESQNPRPSGPPSFSGLEPSAELYDLLPTQSHGNKTFRQMAETDVERERSIVVKEFHKLGIPLPYAENGVLKRSSDIDRSTPFRHGRWKDEELRLAVDIFKRGASYAQIAELFHRSFGSINSKLVFVLDPKYARQNPKKARTIVTPPWQQRAILAMRSFPNQEGTQLDVRKFVEETWDNLDTVKARGANLLKWQSTLARAISTNEKIVKTRRKCGKASIWKLMENDDERREVVAELAAEREAEPVIDNTPAGIVKRLDVGPGKKVLGYTTRHGFVRFDEPVHT